MSGIGEKEFNDEVEEFDSSFDAILADEDISDEEINKTLDEKLGARESDQAVDANEDQTTNTNDDLQAGVDPNLDAKSKADQHKADTDLDDGTDWKARCIKAEDSLATEKQKTNSWAGRIEAANKRATEAEVAAASIIAGSASPIAA